MGKYHQNPSNMEGLNYWRPCTSQVCFCFADPTGYSLTKKHSPTSNIWVCGSTALRTIATHTTNQITYFMAAITSSAKNFMWFENGSYQVSFISCMCRRLCKFLKKCLYMTAALLVLYVFRLAHGCADLCDISPASVIHCPSSCCPYPYSLAPEVGSPIWMAANRNLLHIQCFSK